MFSLLDFLKRPKENQANILENLPLGLAQFEQNGKILSCNSQFLKVCGAEKVKGKKSFKFPLFRKLNLLPKIAEGLKGQSFNLEATPNLPTDRVKNFYHFQGIPIANGLILVAENITAEKRSSEDAQEYIRKLQREQSRFLASVNSLALGFIIIDVKNNILIKNDAIDKLLSLKNLEGNVLLKGDIASIEEKLKAGFDLKSAWEKSLKEKKTTEIKEIIFENRFLRLFIAPIIMGEEVIGVVILIEDITEAKILDRAKDEFFSIASHELRTPLTAIKGNTTMIRDYYAEAIKDPQLKTMIDDIHESSVRLIEMVNDFLDVSRLEQGKMVFKNVQFDLSILVAETIKELETLATEKKIFLKFEPPKEKLPAVFADKDKIKQVLSNLIGNSIKFTEKGGVTINLSLVNNFLKISVIDTGRGIPPENQALLFRKFQQAGSSLFTRDTTKGTGLGLYISKLIVEGLGGQIKLERSEVGKGSTFSFTLPVGSLSLK